MSNATGRKETQNFEFISHSFRIVSLFLAPGICTRRQIERLMTGENRLRDFSRYKVASFRFRVFSWEGPRHLTISGLHDFWCWTRAVVFRPCGQGVCPFSCVNGIFGSPVGSALAVSNGRAAFCLPSSPWNWGLQNKQRARARGSPISGDKQKKAFHH